MLFKVLPGCIDRSLRKVCTTPDILNIKPQLCAVLQSVLSTRFPEDRLAVVPQLRCAFCQTNLPSWECSSAAIVPNKRTDQSEENNSKTNNHRDILDEVPVLCLTV